MTLLIRVRIITTNMTNLKCNDKNIKEKVMILDENLHVLT